MTRKTPHKREPFKVLILGGSYAGLAAALNLTDLCEGRPSRAGFEAPVPGLAVPFEITIVDERDGYCSPLALVEAEYADKAWKKFSDIPSLQHRHIHCIQGSVIAVDCEKMCASIKPHKSGSAIEHKYDYLIAATGLRRVWPTVPQSLTRDEYLNEARGHIDLVRDAEHGVVVIGGGAVGIEMAAETKLVYPNTQVTLIHSRERLLSAEPLPDDFKDQTLKLLREGGVEVIMGKRVIEISPGHSRTTLKLSDGTELRASHVISAISKPTSTTMYLPKSVLDSEDLVRITPSLHFANSDRHLAIGDIAAWSGIKRCGGAMHMGHFAAINIHQHMLHGVGLIEQVEYKTLSEFPPAIGLALGDTAIGWWAEGGIQSGPKFLELMFGTDLGWSICWNHLGLGKGVES
ncbi:hypothetical protein LTR37_015249 [Vermiconidia calcicola]|uniref:Uncharacterized protein n=1 Tax=Vermiconidia calcicola TaxID=1690605 RepID=A0ACC3MSC7_9PEZI|nr:hypothetical protein LTR37_015249 [Vermiconidia calcicola]